MTLFVTVRFLDILDILLISFIMYEIYMLIKGTVAFNIFIAIILLYLLWLLVRALNMELLASLMGQVMGVGALALLIVFQQEIRRFLILIGTNNHVARFFKTDRLFQNKSSGQQVKMLAKACENMARSKTGALIIIAHKSELQEYVRTGEKINARISDALIETIFFKNSPLHDGAMIIVGNKIVAARCIMPITSRRDIAPSLGLRHRAAIGITEVTDAFAIVVSEERGQISVAEQGNIKENIPVTEFITLLKSVMLDENTEEIVKEIIDE